MATNGNNSGNMEFTGTPNLGNGISGAMQNRLIKSQFSNNFWNEESGLLKSAITELEQMKTQYSELEKISDRMTKAQAKSIKIALMLTNYN